MKKIAIVLISIGVFAMLGGCSAKGLNTDLPVKNNVDKQAEEALVDDINEESNLEDSINYTLNLTTPGDDVFKFEVIQVSELYIENNDDEAITWEIKKEGEDEVFLSGELSAGEKTVREEYLLSEGNYKLGVKSEKNPTVKVYAEVNQLD